MSTTQFAEALYGLLNDNARRAEWNQWLQEFQRKPQAWEACYEVIANPQTPNDVKIFAAQTLRNKVTLDLHQVPQAQLMHLKQQFMTLLMQNSSSVPQVAVQLCLALAVLAIKLPEWTNVVEEMIHSLGSDDTISILYEFLRVFPDEITAPRDKLIPEDLLKVRELSEVKAPAPKVIEYIINTYEAVVAKSQVRLVFEALTSWIRQVDVHQVVNSPVVDWVLESLQNKSLSGVAAECLVAIIRGSHNIHKATTREDADSLAAKIMSVDWPTLLAHPEILEGVNAMLIFSAMVETWHPLVVRQGGVYHQIFEVFIQILSLPAEDTEIVQHSFDAMEKIKTLVTMPIFNTGQDPWPQYGCKLAEAYLKYLEYPEGRPDEDVFEGDRTEEETFRMSRYDIADMLKICCAIAGADKISQLFTTHLRALVEHGAVDAYWQKIEATLFAIRSIARVVALENRHIVDVMHLLGRAGSSVKVMHAAVLIIGRYSSWTVAHGDTLPLQLELLERAFACKDPTVLKACGHAVMYMGFDCGQLMAQYTSPLIQKYREHISVFDAETLQSMSTGIGQIISEQPYEMLRAGLLMFSQPVMELVVQCNANPSAVTPATLAEISTELEGLASFIASFSAENGALPIEERHVHPLNEFVAAASGPFISFGQIFGGQSRDAITGLCRVFSNLTTVCVGNIPQLTPRILEVVASAAQHFVEPVIYEYSGVVLRTFKLMLDGRAEDDESSEVVSPELMSQIYQYSLSVSQVLFAKLESQDALQSAAPALVEQGLLYLSDVLVAFPNEMVADGHFEKAYSLAVRCLTCDNYEILTAVGDFFHEIVHYTQYWGDNESPQTSVGVTCAQVVTRYSQEALSNVFEGYLYFYYDFGPGANFIVDSIVGIVGPEVLKIVGSLLNAIDGDAVSDQEKQALLARINTKISARGRGSGSQINNFLQTFKARAILPR